MTLKCDPGKDNILQLKIVRLSHFCGETCPIFHDFCVIFLTSSSVVPIQKSHTRYSVTPAQARPSPSSFVTALFIIPNPDSICCVSLVNIYNILHKCVMAHGKSISSKSFVPCHCYKKLIKPKKRQDGGVKVKEVMK